MAVRSRWIHRRVEQITFPLPSDRVYRRHVSIDFTIPTLTPVGKKGHERYYVPLSLLRRWPPLLRLDLRGPSGEPLPLLTADQNALADSALLRAHAEAVLKSAGLKLDEDSKQAIETLAGLRRSSRLAPPRGEVLSGALISLIPPDKFGKLTPEQEALRNDELFVELAGALRDHTILWLRVEGSPGDREVVKIAYDAPFAAHVRPWSRQAFGIAPFEVEFQVPHLGGSGSYHLALSAPPPLQISDAAMVIREPGTAEGYPDKEKLIAACTAKKCEDSFQTPEGVLSLYADTEARDARFYVSGPRTGSAGQVRIAMIVQASGLIRPGALAGFAITALLAVVTFRLGAVLEAPEAAVTTLLVAPALLAYLVVRPSDHAVVGQFVSALRRILIALGTLPLAAATALSVSHKWHCGLKAGLVTLTAVSLLLTLIMIAAWLISQRESAGLPFSEAAAAPAERNTPSVTTLT